jgi:hypothetical protein
MRLCPRGRFGILTSVLLTFLIPLLCGASPAAETTPSIPDSRLMENEFRLMPVGSRPMQLAHGFVEAASIRLFVEGRLWRQGTDYKVRARSGIIIPLREWLPPKDGVQDAPASAEKPWS